jgi:hypothetical protein
MLAALLIRVGTHTISLVCGSMAAFCLYYAGQIHDHSAVCYLFDNVLKYGGCAVAVVYFQGKYLDK